ncbi:hypothetical protein BsWGS_17886 [Bradybaena similaris]
MHVISAYNQTLHFSGLFYPSLFWINSVPHYSGIILPLTFLVSFYPSLLFILKLLTSAGCGPEKGLLYTQSPAVSVPSPTHFSWRKDCTVLFQSPAASVPSPTHFSWRKEYTVLYCFSHLLYLCPLPDTLQHVSIADYSSETTNEMHILSHSTR